jgi:hypothetical protein
MVTTIIYGRSKECLELYLYSPPLTHVFVGYTNTEVHVFFGLILQTADKTGRDKRLLAVKWWWGKFTQNISLCMP